MCPHTKTKFEPIISAITVGKYMRVVSLTSLDFLTNLRRSFCAACVNIVSNVGLHSGLLISNNTLQNCKTFSGVRYRSLLIVEKLKVASKWVGEFFHPSTHAQTDGQPENILPSALFID